MDLAFHFQWVSITTVVFILVNFTIFHLDMTKANFTVDFLKKYHLEYYNKMLERYGDCEHSIIQNLKRARIIDTVFTIVSVTIGGSCAISFILYATT